MKNKIRDIVLSAGADLCGFASIDRFSSAPDGYAPTVIFADCKTVIAFRTAKALEDRYNCTAVPMPSDGSYEYWDIEKMEGRGLLSMRHLAMLAGLGSIGKNSLLITERYGNMVTLGAILTDLCIPFDDLSNDLCMANCKKCIEACPVGAIENKSVNQKLCREHTYGKTARGFDTVGCNMCRAICPMNRTR